MTSTSDIERLFAEVYANPNDDQIRRVLADALLAIDDPRGVLILFQLEPDRDQHQRAMLLVQQHGMSWMGPLRGVVLPVAYERGFLASAQLVPEKTHRVDFDSPLWATVHTLDVGELAFYEAFSITSAMSSLKKLTGMTERKLRYLKERHPDAPTHLEIVLDGSPDGVGVPYDPV